MKTSRFFSRLAGAALFFSVLTFSSCKKLVEFRKNKPTGFFGSILLTLKRYGFETAEMMYHWIKDNTEPPKVTYRSGIFITRGNFEKVMKERGVL